ncbi:MAG: DEAD/DEAH box helicase [Lachnospiraceae bacterium]|nr:DEAD/DEAH box helicase [Lachnospiraceae bacterium]
MLKKEDLHKYEVFCVDFLLKSPEALLILQMGLGKTIITLTAIALLMYDWFEVNKCLVVAPLRVTKVWMDEAAKWSHTKDLRMSRVTGTAAERKAALKKDADIYVINRENLAWLVKYLEDNKTAWPFDMVVLDELSSFKNYKSQRFKAMRMVRPYVKRMVGLTGTPTPQGLEDLFAEVGIIDNFQRFGRFIGRFRDAYFRKGAYNPYTGVVYNYVPLPDAEERIYDKISDIAISMKSVDYLDMPECVYVDHEVDMDAGERAIYEEMKKELVVELDGETVTSQNAAVLSNKLMQMASGCLYTEDGSTVNIHNKKLEMLSDLIEQANGQNVLVVYHFRFDHDRIKEYLREQGYEARDIKTDADIDEWNAGKIQVGMISPMSAGHGLNLQKGGHIEIWVTLPWSYDYYSQTVARLWRQGTTAETVTIHHIICKDTVDLDVMDALERKSTTQENLIAAVKANLRKETVR